MQYLLRPFLIAVFLVIQLPAFAIVYSLQRGRGVAAVKKALHAERVLRDGVTYNGAKGEIEVYTSDTPISESAAKVAPLIKDYRKMAGAETILIDIPEEKYLTRLMILNTGSGSKTLLFQLRLPKDALDYKPEKSWPDHLPKPVNVKIDQVMQLEKSKSVFCRYSSKALSAEALTSEMSMMLAGEGWKSVSSDQGGGAFMDKAGGQMIFLSSFQGKDRAHASIFARPVKGELK